MSSDTSERVETVTVTLPSGGKLFVNRFTDGVNDEVTYTAGFQSMDLPVEVNLGDEDAEDDDEYDHSMAKEDARNALLAGEEVDHSMAKEDRRNAGVQ